MRESVRVSAWQEGLGGCDQPGRTGRGNVLVGAKHEGEGGLVRELCQVQRAALRLTEELQPWRDAKAA